MSIRRAILNPVGLVLLVASALLGGTATISALATWSDRLFWVAPWGLLAYAVTVAVVAWPRTIDPSIRMVRRIRAGLAVRLREQAAADRIGAPSPIAAMLTEALTRLDDEILPALERIVERNSALDEQLRRYASGSLAAPKSDVLERLEEIRSRQREAIATCVSQVASADAALLALAQESNEPEVIGEAEKWVRNLLAAHGALIELLRTED